MAVVEHLRARGTARRRDFARLRAQHAGLPRGAADQRRARGGRRAAADRAGPAACRCSSRRPRSRRRARCSHAYPATQVIVSDDGLQHYALAARHRDLRVRRARHRQRLAAAGRPAARALAARCRPGAAHGRRGRHRRVRRRAPAGDCRRRARDGTRIAAGDAAGPAADAPSPAIAKPRVLLRHAARARACSSTQTHRPARPPRFRTRIRPTTAGMRAALHRERRGQALAAASRRPGPCRCELEIEPQFWLRFDRLLDAKLSSAHGPQTA